MQGYTQTDPVGTLKKKKPNLNHNSSQDCALQKPPETLLEPQLQDTQMEKKYLHPGQFTISKSLTKENQFLTTGTSNSPIQFLTEQLHKEPDPSQHQQEMCIHNVTPEPYTEETNLQPQCLLDHVMIKTETTAEITDKCTTKITSNYAIQTSGKRSTTTTKEGSGEESSIRKKLLQETSKNEKPGNAPNNTKTGRSILTLLQKNLRQKITESAGNTECSSSNRSDTDSYESKENTPEATGGASLGTTKEETSPGRKREVGSPSSKIGSTEWVNREPKPKKLCK